MKVKTGKSYIYRPVGLDIFDSRVPNVKPGDIVTVVQPYGCPKNGTMGHCFIAKDGEFQGLVLVNSLENI